MQAPIAPHVATRDLIIDEIKRDIVTGALAFGQHIPEAHYATRFNVSRTPVREAVLSLRTLGLVTVKPRSGSYVLEFSEASLADLFRTRYQIEAASVRYATPQAREALIKVLEEVHEQILALNADGTGQTTFHALDTMFHRALVETNNSARLLEIYRSIELCTLAARHRLAHSVQLQNIATDHHGALLDALRADDIDRFEEALKTHLDYSHALLRTQLLGIKSAQVL